MKTLSIENAKRRLSNATDEAIDFTKNVEGSDVMLAGGVTLAGGYVAAGIGLAASSTTAVAVGVGAVYVGTGLMIGGACKALYDSFKEDQKQS